MPPLPADAKAVTYPSGGRSLTAWIGMPDNPPARAPVVIFLHGGFAFGSDDFDMARPYRDAGFVVVTPILRAENGQDGNFSMFYDEVDDVIAVTDYVRRLPDIDPERIFLAGHSIGGTMTMLAAMTSPWFRGVASLSGSPDQILWIKFGGYNRIAPFDINDEREYVMRSPLSYARSFKAPARIYYGSAEPFFGPSSRKLAEVATAAGADVVTKEMPGDHFGAVPAEIADSIIFFRNVGNAHGR